MSITRLGATPLRWPKHTHPETAHATWCDRNPLLSNSFGVRMKKSGNPKSCGRATERVGVGRDSSFAATRRGSGRLRQLGDHVAPTRIEAQKALDLHGLGHRILVAPGHVVHHGVPDDGGPVGRRPLVVAVARRLR